MDRLSPSLSVLPWLGSDAVTECRRITCELHRMAAVHAVRNDIAVAAARQGVSRDRQLGPSAAASDRELHSRAGCSFAR